MSLPDIPAQDLAKLVLGYLAEEQLMTAYDEFLQSSPYLDALHNEYDRIFMTSLKHIVAEYRAVRIMVETCQPISLRRKLLQCGNLLEIIKFLINNVDIQTSPPLSNSQLILRNKRESKFLPNSRTSSFRHSGNLTGVETTPLADLPGYMSNSKKHVKVISPEVAAQMQDSCDHEIPNVQAGEPSAHFGISPEEHYSHNKSHLEGSVQDACNLSIRSHNISEERLSSHDLSISKAGPDRSDSLHDSAAQPSRASAVHHTSADGDTNKTTTPLLVPTPKSTRNSCPREIKIVPKVQMPTLYKAPEKIIVEPKKMQYLLQVTTKSNSKKPNDCQSSNFQVSKANEHKVTIISDVKVDKSVSNMQSLLNIPSYRADGGGFTNDEIMAMPTIFIVPSTAPPLVSPVNHLQPTCVQNTSLITTINNNPTQSFGPLTIDIDQSPEKSTTDLKNTANKNCTDNKANEFVDSVMAMLEHKNASLPKDNVIRVNKSSTPQVMPLVRKSCSTPRRTSHIRVLDFTTPRRILQEGINEIGQENEVLISRSPNLMICDREEVPEKIGNNVIEPKIVSSDKSNKDNKLSKKMNWDADLRALLAHSAEVESPISKSDSKSTKTKKHNDRRSKKATPIKSSRKSSSKKSPKVKICKSTSRSAKKKIKKKEKNEESKHSVPEAVSISVKPTINIVTEWNPSPPKDANKSETKSITEEQSDTPEMDRISLQNVIGAKLNISDLLETPYKQALYDIQMETPRFLQPDIPDDPISEIKISDIPTPRFLSSALGQTPSSYNSRPTDYSSGGSYYKPDEHEYPPILDIDNLECTKVKIDKTIKNTKHKTQDSSSRKSAEKSSRPVRQCTKNVSYVDSQARSTEKKCDPDTSYSDTSTIWDEDKDKRFSKIYTPKTKLNQAEKNISSSKRKISPKVKKISPKKFMKIKPRKSTPASSRKPKKESFIVQAHISPKFLNRKRTFSKEKTENTPVASPAPTKSRRKSSTPRKINTKKFNSLSPEEIPPKVVSTNEEVHKFTAPAVNIDSDTEHINLRWSDDGSRASSEATAQSENSKVSPTKCASSEVEDISKIKEYIAKCSETPNAAMEEDSGSLHLDLIKRGFDAETAKSIERDLLDGTPAVYNVVPQIEASLETIVTTNENVIPEISAQKNQSEQVYSEHSKKEIETDISRKSDKVIRDTQHKDDSLQEEEEEEEEEIELSTHECNEDTYNYFTCSHNSSNETLNKEQYKFKDSYSMEVCLEEETIRLRTGPLTGLFDEEPEIEVSSISVFETEAAVSSISNIETLYTPLKENRSSIQAQCIEIFDSTLTSLDTPLKSPKNDDVTVTEIVLEVEQVVEKHTTDSRMKFSTKRKRQSGSCSDESSSDVKKNKRESRYIPNIQNIDIESVLSKLHGP